MKFKASSSPISRIKMNETMSRIVLCSLEPNNTVTIYESESNTNFSIEQVIQLDETVHSIQCGNIGDGEDILYIGVSGKVLCYTNKRIEPKYINAEISTQVCSFIY